jgi:ABC-type nitrate/sulfonate/bicarbonate transport system permease component
MLVVAELLAAQDGLAYRLVQSQAAARSTACSPSSSSSGLIGVVSDLRFAVAEPHGTRGRP